MHGVAMFDNLDGFSLVQILHVAKSEPMKKGLVLELLQVREREREREREKANSPA